MTAVIPFVWTAGAIWILPEGEILEIPGFHDDWIQKHQDMVPGCANVCDVVLRMRWVSAVTYAKKYVELLISSRNDEAAIDLLIRYLGLNLERWDSALVMTMDEEGYIKIISADFGDLGAVKSRISGSLGK